MPVFLRSGLLGLLFAAGTASAAILNVDPARGDDANPGSAEAPYRTLLKAVKAAAPGDLIQLLPNPEPIRESLWIANKSGEPGKPIIFDGGGNLISACQPLHACSRRRNRTRTRTRSGAFSLSSMAE
jgi:hypothetical protein